MALVALAVVVAALLTRGTSTPPRPRAERLPSPRPAGTFVDSVGVNVHMNYSDTAYGQVDRVAAALRELGARHVRDGLPVSSAAVAALATLGHDGVRADLLLGPLGSNPQTVVTAPLTQLGSAVEMVEGPNEPDLSGLANWPALTRSYAAALSSTLGADPVLRGIAVLPSSLVRERDRALLGEGDEAGATVNLHSYPFGAPPERALTIALRHFQAHPLTQRVWLTETGYTNAVRSSPISQPPVSEHVAAIYELRLLMASFSAGIRRTYIYELVDEKPDPGLTADEQHFGLIGNDFTPKPAFTALRTVMALAAGGDRRQGLTVTSAPAPDSLFGPPVRAMDLVRPDGTRLLMVWRPASLWDIDSRTPTTIAPARVTLGFAAPVARAEVIDPIPGGTPPQRVRAVSSLRLALGADPLAILLSP